MATVEEVKITGRKYRVWDAVNNIWKRISYWTKASDVEFDDEMNLEDKVNEINGNIDEINENIDDLNNSFSNALTALKNTAIAKAVGANGSTFTAVIAKLAQIIDRGKITASLNTSTTSYTVPQGYHNGAGKVSITLEEKSQTAETSAVTVTPSSGKVLSKVTVNPTPSQEKTITSSRSAQTVTPDSGKLLSKVTVNKYPDANGTYMATSRDSALDMGATNNLRYVNTNGVPNTNSGTYDVTSNGIKDMGATNTYRYVNVNVANGVIKVLSGYGKDISLGGWYDPKQTFIMRGGSCNIYGENVVFDSTVNYIIIVFDSAVVNKKLHGVEELGKSSSRDVSLGGNYDTQKILVSVSFDEYQSQRGFAIYSDHVNIQNNNAGYSQDVPYDIIIFN